MCKQLYAFFRLVHQGTACDILCVGPSPRLYHMNNFAQALRLHRHLILFSGIYGMIVIGLAFMLNASWADFKPILSFFIPAAATTFFFPPLVLLYYFLGAMKTATRDRHWVISVLETFEGHTSTYIRDGRLHNALVAILALLPITLFFCIGKSMIPALGSYTLDPLLATTDRLLHFGYYPHEFLVPWIERTGLSGLIDSAYLSWFMVIYLITAFACWADPDQHRRQRFLWTYSLCWVAIGNIIAIIDASVGPLFFHEFYPYISNPYEEFVAYLHTQEGLKIFVIADELLSMVRDDSPININAISAMPSLHVAMCALGFLYFRSINNALWQFLVLFFIIILIGSVYLGWHYAIDGYAGALLAWGLWRFSDLLVKKLPA